MPTGSKQPQEAQVPAEVLSALLDYYFDRATGFASLFVASVFGLVTLSALVKTYLGDNFWWYYIAGIPYLAFIFSGWHTLNRFSFYANIAHYIENWGLRERYKQEIEKIHLEIQVGKKAYNTNL